MSRLLYRIKYYWHLLKVKELSVVIPDCLDEKLKHKLEKKIDYHKQAVLNLMC